MKRLFSVVLIPLLALPAFSPAKTATLEYSIQAIRYASAEDEVAGLDSILSSARHRAPVQTCAILRKRMLTSGFP